MADGGEWDGTSGFDYPRNANVMNKEGMPSPEAEAARKRAQEIMSALKSGEPGAADKLMGEPDPKKNVGVVPLKWMKWKYDARNEKKSSQVDKQSVGAKGKGNDAVVR